MQMCASFGAPKKSTESMCRRALNSAEWDGETIISAGESMNQNGIAQLSSTSTGVYHKLAR
jgi:hypothetical protein